MFPKKHYEILNQVKDVGHLFNIAQRISGVVYDALKAEGTNIIVSNGAAAGQVIPHVVLHIIPRFRNDSVTVKWEKINLPNEEIEDIQKELIDKLKAFNIEKEDIKPQKLIVVTQGFQRRIP